MTSKGNNNTRQPAVSRRAKSATSAGNSPIAEVRAFPEDAALLERSRAYWQMGEWDKLTDLAEGGLEQHPERAKLALLAAVGFAQNGDLETARHHARQARDWGCSRDILARVMIGGVYNSLGRVAALQGDDDRATGYFEKSIGAVNPRADAVVLARARKIREKTRLGQLPQAVALFKEDLAARQERAGRRVPADLLARLDHLERLIGMSEEAPSATPDAVLQGRIDAVLRRLDDVAGDFWDAADAAIEEFDPLERCYFHLALSARFAARKDRLMTIDSLAEAEVTLPPGLSPLRSTLARRYLELGQPWLASQVMLVGQIAWTEGISADQEKALLQALRRGEVSSAEHGHALLLEHLAKHPPTAPKNKRKRVLIEVGTTRERVPGQGSTLKIAGVCKDLGMHMITVDMDPRNGALARRSFDQLGYDFETVTSRGEDYLASYDGVIDYVFLDAYDFDHGNHSDLRQSRYQAFLGSKIDELACHKMHLDCAEALITRLAPDGLICIDDTWQDEAGNWTAKGTTAVPFLLKSGFVILSARNNGVLMRRGQFRPHVASTELPKTSTRVGFPDFELTVSTEDRSADAYKTRDWYEEVTSPFYRHVKEALDPTLCLDIGANYGAVSLTLKTVMPDVPLISVEPNTSLHPYLEHNLGDWRDKGWQLEKALVGRKSHKDATFHVNPAGSQDSRVIAVSEDWPRVDTRSVTLKDLVLESGQTQPRVYIKIDTQGFEQEILEGSAEYLESSQDWLIRMEFAPDWMRSQGGDPEAFLGWVARTFRVAEFPKRYGFVDRPGDLLTKRALSEADVSAFMSYCTGLNRRGKGWVDLLLCHRQSLVVNASKSS